MDFNELCKKIMELVGGRSNILNSMNCYTRLRLALKDKNIVNVDEIKKLPNVLGVVFDGNQLHVIVGPGKAAKAGLAMKSLLDSTSATASQSQTNGSAAATQTIDYMATKNEVRSKQKSGKFNQIIRKISAIFVPIIPAFIVCGLFLAIHETIGMYVEGYKGTNIGMIMGIISSSIFTILNVLVGYNATKEFGGDGVLGAILAAIMSSDVLNKIKIGDFQMQAGRGGVISVIMVAIAAAYLEKLLRKKMPNSIDAFVTPFITIVVMSAVALFALQPLGGFISDGIGFVVKQIVQYVPVLLGLVPLFYLLLVLTGTHHGLIAVNAALISQLGVTYLLPVQLMAGAAQVGAGIYVLLKTKNKQLKKLTVSSTPIGILGIGEPLIWGMSVPLKTPFIAAGLGGFAGGTFIACMHLYTKTPEATGIQAALLVNNPLLFVAGFAIALVAGFLVQFLVGFKDSYEVKDEKTGEVKTVTENTSYLLKKFEEYRLAHPKKK